MKVARYMEPGRIVVEETERPVISDGEVLVRMRACGVCGTDVKTYQRGHPLIQPGSVLGHEVAGDVVESRHPRFGVDMRVAVAPYTSCGECAECRRGHPSLCSNRGEAFLQPGGFAEFLRVPRRLADVGLYHVPDGMSYEVASLAEPLACCVHGLEATENGPRMVEEGLSIATPLAPVIGYDRTAELANEAFRTRKTVREVAREAGVLPEAELDRLLDAKRMTGA